jgi:hypothetical protein
MLHYAVYDNDSTLLKDTLKNKATGTNNIL